MAFLRFGSRLPGHDDARCERRAVPMFKFEAVMMLVLPLVVIGVGLLIVLVRLTR